MSKVGSAKRFLIRGKGDEAFWTRSGRYTPPAVRSPMKEQIRPLKSTNLAVNHPRAIKSDLPSPNGWSHFHRP